MYKFVNQQQVKELAQWCEGILHAVQDEVRDYFTFEIRLIGSGDKRLVTRNADEPFDLDYNLILQKDKKNLLNNPQEIKKIFMSKFNKVLATNVRDYKHASDSTPVMTLKILNDDKISFSFDVAITVENNNGAFYKLIHDKNTGRYIWNEVAHSTDYMEKFRLIKANGYWVDFKKRYLKLKNMHLYNREEVKSFSVFLETLNEYKF